ncbi:DUF2254 domain-containing protein [Nitrosococcus wardiae]|uniref:DUF2254 domain-containing protein n=1 Tax=Nitrosococcus wardiae TaxID=1814290 RepID=UPI00141BE443|nr:DUF2254 domain-containing protein [Nitrosococcus wardiae]
MKNIRFDIHRGSQNLTQLWRSGEKLKGKGIKFFLKRLWYRFTINYWFLPALILLGAVLLSFLTLFIDDRYGSGWATQWRWIYSHEPAGARAMLSTVAGSMITVAGVVFSITIVVLTLASNQFGPRLIRNFMLNKGNQLVLGVFTATYLYCLLILRRIQAVDNITFVPSLSLVTAILLAILSIAVLIYYIHHVTTFMQVENVLNSVSRELHGTLERLFTDRENSSADGREITTITAPICTIPISQSGYIQAVDHQSLVRLAYHRSGQLELLYRPGCYLVAGATVARFGPCAEADDELVTAVNTALLLGSHPTPEQDPEFAVRQLVEVAVRALSRGVNDPFTAMTCIDRIATALAIAASRVPPPTAYRDNDGQVRLIDYPVTFADLAKAAYSPLRRYGGEQITVVLKLLESLAMILPLTYQERDQQVLYEHGTLIYERCLARVEQDQDRRELDNCYRILKKLNDAHHRMLQGRWNCSNLSKIFNRKRRM